MYQKGKRNGIITTALFPFFPSCHSNKLTKTNKHTHIHTHRAVQGVSPSMQYQYYTRFCWSSGCTSALESAFPFFAFHKFLKKPSCFIRRCSSLEVEMESAESPDACEASFNALEDAFCTCCRHTCTASCTRTKHHAAPIKSRIPDLESSRCTCRFGLAMAICNQ